MRQAQLLCAIVLGTMTSLATADSVRSSDNYAIQYDVISSGGGSSASSGYSQPQAVVGQQVVWNTYSSTNYEFQPVGVFLLPSDSGIFQWLDFD